MQADRTAHIYKNSAEHCTVSGLSLEVSVDSISAMYGTIARWLPESLRSRSHGTSVLSLSYKQFLDLYCRALEEQERFRVSESVARKLEGHDRHAWSDAER